MNTITEQVRLDVGLKLRQVLFATRDGAVLVDHVVAMLEHQLGRERNFREHRVVGEVGAVRAPPLADVFGVGHSLTDQFAIMLIDCHPILLASGPAVIYRGDRNGNPGVAPSVQIEITLLQRHQVGLIPIFVT